MGILKEFIARYREKKEKEKALEDDISIQRRVVEKQKDANERELERYIEEQRKKQIERDLEKFRKHKSAELWHTNCFSGNKYLFKNNKFKKPKWRAV